MSETLAIAAVSATMKWLLHNSLSSYGVETVISDLKVTAIAPGKVADDAPRLNLFFYRATQNQGWAQNELPSRNQKGELVTNPYLAIDLHYLITAHGAKDFQSEVMLGYAMQIFHEHPVLTRGEIRDALTPSTPGNPPNIPPVTNPIQNTDVDENILSAIAGSGLAEQIEQIKITPYQLSLEESSNVWMTLQTQYRPMAAYTASVALIRRERKTRPTLPVQSYNIYALPFKQPFITDVLADGARMTPITTNAKVVLRGQALRSDELEVRLSGKPVQSPISEISDDRIVFALPADARAGVQGVQIRHLLEMSQPAEKRPVLESNVAAFVLQPRIKREGEGTPNVGDFLIKVIPPTPPRNRRLSVEIDPPVEASQRVELLLNEAAPTAEAHTFEAEARAANSPPVSTFVFNIPEVKDSAYLVRVRVDGAESPLDFTAGAPKVTLS
ncbi:MAG: DUF4255 domain-containing protein [Blastocatellia bacterium]|nr:DUF4255 domain-containing protein [Blastocatellia bacterium]